MEFYTSVSYLLLAFKAAAFLNFELNLFKLVRDQSVIQMDLPTLAVDFSLEEDREKADLKDELWGRLISLNTQHPSIDLRGS